MKTTDYNTYPIREAAELTNSYVAGNILSPTNGSPFLRNQLILYTFFTLGSLTNCDIKVEFSADGTNWTQETASSLDTDGVSTELPVVHRLVATGNPRILVPQTDAYIRISALGTGDVTGSSLSIRAAIALN